MRTLIAFAIGLACILAAPTADAGLVRYAFTVTIGSGPFAAQSTGTFAYDTSIIPAPAAGVVVGGLDLLVNLDLTWNGIQYDETTANTGGMVFDASGTLVDIVFGNECVPLFCLAGAGDEEWFVLMRNSSFTYRPAADPSVREIGEVSFQLQADQVDVSEPAMLLLVGTALLAGAIGRRRRVW